MKKKVLILGVAAVQEDAIKCLQEMGHEVHAIAQKADGPGAKTADVFREINFVNRREVIDYIRQEGIDVVYSTGSDLAMPISCAISEALDLPHFVSEEAAATCNNKDKMRRRLGPDFHGNIPFQIFDQLEELKLDLPVIVKPTDSQGQRGINLVEKLEDFPKAYENAKQYSRSGKVIAEKYVVGPEISVNCYMVDGKMVFVHASDRVTWEQYVGLIHKHEVPSKVLNEKSREDLKQILENACNEIGIHNGPMYAQMKVMDNVPYIIEITPRLDGCHMWKLLTLYTGINLMKATFEHLLEGKTKEFDKKEEKHRPMTLEFICQKPHTKADYSAFEEELKDPLSYTYYKQGDLIRPVNGKYEKIGYFIYED